MDNLLIINISQIATPKGNCAQKGLNMNHIELITDGYILVEHGKIKEINTMNKLNIDWKNYQGTIIDGKGKCAIPGFVDSHTHFVFGGYRPDEFLRRLQGASYMEIMNKGGGIMSTVQETRRESFENLYETGKKRLDNAVIQGVTTIEGKSGYGLDLHTEIKQLKVMKALNETHAVDIIATFLGAHAIPEEYKGKTEEYIDLLLEAVLPAVKEEQLAKYCDVFCEKGVFSVEESRKILEGGKVLGFTPRIHADEIEALGGAELAVEVNAASADHLLVVTEEEIKKMADANIVATLLPGTAFSLNKPYAPARKLIEGGCAVALASDLNPGSCFAYSIPLLFALGVIHMKMTIEEALTAMTINGAAALEMADNIGTLEVGKQADINLLAYPDYRFLVYHTATNIVEKVIKKGVLIYDSEIKNI